MQTMVFFSQINVNNIPLMICVTGLPPGDSDSVRGPVGEQGARHGQVPVRENRLLLRR